MTKPTDPPIPDTKLTRSKQGWAREGKFLTGQQARPDAERLPPGQHLVRDWPVLDLGLVPDLSENQWRLEIGGAVKTPLRWSFSDFLAQEQSEEVTDIHCVTTWSRYDNRWRGIDTRHILDLVEPRADVGYVALSSYDGYTTNLTLEDFAAPKAMLVHSWEGQPLTLRHGGPVRLMIPHLYFWKSAKWIRSIEFRLRDQPGFWEVRGYHNRGDPWAEERYSD